MASEATRQRSEPAATRWVVSVLSAAVFVAALVVLYAWPRSGSSGAEPGLLATVNALLNATAACLLIAGFGLVRNRRVVAHRRCMLAAFAVSAAFLVTYLVHHARVGSVPFEGEGWVRAVYYAVLIPHIVLAVPIVPLALLTVYRGWTSRLAAHRRIARWTLPLWLYVSVSGVIVYWMLYRL